MKKKILGMFILIISYILINFIWNNAVFAITQTTTTDINSINSNKYPQIKEKLQELKKAKSKGWTTLESSIDGGIEAIAASYIKRGQNTIYFQKNVTNSLRVRNAPNATVKDLADLIGKNV